MVLSSWTYSNNSLQEALPSSTQLKWPTIKKIVIVPLPAISQGASLNHRLYNFIASSRGSWANMFVARGLKQLELFYHPDLNCLSCSSHHTPSHLRLLIRTSQLVICCSELRNLHPSSDIFCRFGFFFFLVKSLCAPLSNSEDIPDMCQVHLPSMIPSVKEVLLDTRLYQNHHLLQSLKSMCYCAESVW